MICALSLDIVLCGLRLGYWKRRLEMPNVQYFTNKMVAQALSSVNPTVGAEDMHPAVLFLTAIGARN